MTIYEEGTEIWVTAENAYNERVSRVENQIIARLRDRLGTARNANEMFRVFSKFNALFVRPKVRSPLFPSTLDPTHPLTRFAVPFRNTRLNSLIALKKTFKTSMTNSKPNIAPQKPTTCPKCATYPLSQEPSCGLDRSADSYKHT